MSIIHRYLSREIYSASGFVLVAFLMLFGFFDFVNELEDLGKGGYGLQHMAAYVTLTLPSRAYEILPIAVLIGTLYALTNLARHSEITVMRASGLATSSLLARLTGIGLAFVVLTFALGEFVAPQADRVAQRLRLQAQSTVIGQQFRSGLWVKEDTSFINVRTVLPNGELRNIRIYEFDTSHRLKSISEAERGDYIPPEGWRLVGVVRTDFDELATRVERVPEMIWQSTLSPDIVGVMLVAPERMSVSHLDSYIRHLSANQQNAGRYEIALWKKLVYPFAALVMMMLAVPFAFRQHRYGSVSIKVFAGIMIGTVFHMLNGLFSNLGIINNWPPYASAVTPSLLFFAAAGAMLWWTERR